MVINVTAYKLEADGEDKSQTGYELWLRSLSKNVRQNIRTAYNRLQKDGKCLGMLVFRGGLYNTEMQQVSNSTTKKINPQKFFDNLMEMYYRRHEHQYCFKLSWLRKKITNVSNKGYIHLEEGLTIILTCDQKPCAFLSGYISGREFVVPRLTFDDELKFYSPGILLVNETMKYLFSREDLDCLDLGIGKEDYKFKMGGQERVVFRGIIK